MSTIFKREPLPRFWRPLPERTRYMRRTYGWRAAYLDRAYLATRWPWLEELALHYAKDCP